MIVSLAAVKVYPSIEAFPGLKTAVVTIGTFDGVHAGHQQIIKRLLSLAKETGGETVVLTFFPHPRMVLQPDDNDMKLITTMQEREELLRSYGIDHLIIQPFSKEFSRLSAVEFVRDVLVKQIGTKVLVIGYDHHFGRNREGSYKDLEEMAPVYGFRLEEITEKIINDVAVSSTKIRKALLAGDILEAQTLSAHDFSISGIVKHGEKIGTSLGFPTANIEVPEPYKLIPANGIYAVTVEVEDAVYKGMLYIGNRPVFNGIMRVIEVNIFDFNSNLYGQRIKVNLKAFIRGDQMFENVDQLVEKMNDDKQSATKMLS